MVNWLTSPRDHGPVPFHTIQNGILNKSKMIIDGKWDWFLIIYDLFFVPLPLCWYNFLFFFFFFLLFFFFFFLAHYKVTILFHKVFKYLSLHLTFWVWVCFYWLLTTSIVAWVSVGYKFSMTPWRKKVPDLALSQGFYGCD